MSSSPSAALAAGWFLVMALIAGTGAGVAAAQDVDSDAEEYRIIVRGECDPVDTRTIHVRRDGDRVEIVQRDVDRYERHSLRYGPRRQHHRQYHPFRGFDDCHTSDVHVHLHF